MNVAYPIPKDLGHYNGMRTYYECLAKELKPLVDLETLEIPSASDVEMYTNWLFLQKFIPAGVDLIHNPVSYAYTFGTFHKKVWDATLRYEFIHPPEAKPMKVKVPLVMTICDAIPWTHPETFRWKSVVYHWTLYKQCFRSCDHIITVSHASRVDLWKIIPEDKISVIYPGINQALFEKPVLSRYALEAELGFVLPYFLYVGDFGPRKNVARLIKEFVKAREKNGWNYKLVLAGGYGWKDKPVWDLVNKYHECVRVVKNVSFEQLHALYSYADLFVWPSLYEGFGLPPVEAMACGTPVLSSNTSCMPETCGIGAEYFDPFSPGYFENIPAGVNKKGIEVAKAYRWDLAARDTVKVYEEVLE